MDPNSLKPRPPCFTGANSNPDLSQSSHSISQPMNTRRIPFSNPTPRPQTHQNNQNGHNQNHPRRRPSHSRRNIFLHPMPRLPPRPHQPEDQRRRGIQISFPNFQHQIGTPTFHQCLRVYLHDYRSFSSEDMLHRVHSLWNPTHRIDIVRRYRNFYIIHFANYEELEAVIAGGPYASDGALICADHWDPDVELEDLGTPTIAIWVHFYGVPLEFFSQSAGHYVARVVGDPIRVDTEYSPSLYQRYIRAYIWINPDQPFMAGFYTYDHFGEPLWIECRPERVYRVCRACGAIGHKIGRCTMPLEEAQMRIDARLLDLARDFGAGILAEPNISLYGSQMFAYPPRRDYRNPTVVLIQGRS